MRHKLIFFAVLAVLGAAMPAQAKFEVRTTEVSGVEAWYTENSTVPVVDVIISVEGLGSVSDPANKLGRANFAAQMMTEAAGPYDANGFAQALEERTISLSMNAYMDRLMIHVHCLRADAARAGALLAMAITQPTLTEPDMARVKTQMNAFFKQQEESPTYQANRLLAARAFKGHAYANPVYGTAESIAGLSAPDVRDYLAGITRGRMIIAAAGDVDSSLLNDMLRPTLDALPKGEKITDKPTSVTMQGGGETLHQVSNLPQTVIAFSAPGIARDDKRFYTAYLLNHILGGNAMNARLGDEIRQKQGLAYSVSTRLEAQRETNLLSGSLSTRNSTAEAALAAVKAVLLDMRDKGVTTEQCNDARSFVLGNFPLQLDRSSAVSMQLFNMQLNKLGTHYLDDRVTHLQAVSCGDINALAKEILTPEKFLFAVVGGTNDTKAPPQVPAKVGHTDVK